MTSTLNVGTRSAAVKALQTQLAKLGQYKAPIDGQYGPVTKKAVAEFEAANGFRTDGVADGTTRDAIARAAESKVALFPGMVNSRVKNLQSQLQRLGFFKGDVGGHYGPITRAAVRAFEKKHGWNQDGIAGKRFQETIAKEVKALPPAPKPKETWKTVKAPPADFRHIPFRGVTVNVRTRVMVERAESYMRKMGINSKLSFSQGSFSHSVSASAGTHDGGGALDIRISNFSSANADKVVKALRMAGFAAWRRGVNDSFPPHIHAIAIGDRTSSSVAKAQVAEYFRGGDGLVGSKRDIHLTSVGHNIGRPVPNWAR
ncbi:MAG: peptidoglycan-binding protein [Archangium sp.]